MKDMTTGIEMTMAGDTLTVDTQPIITIGDTTLDFIDYKFGEDKYLEELDNYITPDSRDFIRLIGGVYTWREPSENEDDCKTTDNHKNMIQLFYPRALYPKAEEQDEEQEDKLLKFLIDSFKLLTSSSCTIFSCHFE